MIRQVLKTGNDKGINEMLIVFVEKTTHASFFFIILDPE
jgi:hypothetical protein